jgi:hypothetical protein
MVRRLSKAAILTALAIAFTVSLLAGAHPNTAALCLQDDYCTDSGCSGRGGACGAFTDQGACICFFPSGGG